MVSGQTHWLSVACDRVFLGVVSSQTGASGSQQQHCTVMVFIWMAPSGVTHTEI